MVDFKAAYLDKIDIKAALAEYNLLVSSNRIKTVRSTHAGASGDFDESEHPREKDGKFAPKGEGVSQGTDAKDVPVNKPQSIVRDKKPPFMDEQGNHHWNPVKLQNEYDELKKTPAYVGSITQDVDNAEKGDSFDKFRLHGLDVYIPDKNVPDYITVKLTYLENAFKYSNIPPDKRPQIVFTGRDNHKELKYVARDGEEYKTEYAASADFTGGKLRVYDNFGFDRKLYDHEVGHFEQKMIMQEGFEYIEVPKSIRGLENTARLEDYNNMVTILKDKKLLDRNTILELMDDIDFAKSSGVWEAMLEKDLKYYDNGFNALWAVAERQNPTPQGTETHEVLPLELDEVTVKTWKMYRKALRDEVNQRKLNTKWNEIYEDEPHEEQYAGRSSAETFAQSYADVKNAISKREFMTTSKDFVPFPPFPHPDNSEWAQKNPKKYAFMKQYVFKRAIANLKEL